MTSPQVDYLTSGEIADQIMKIVNDAYQRGRRAGFAEAIQQAERAVQRHLPDPPQIDFPEDLDDNRTTQIMPVVE